MEQLRFPERASAEDKVAAISTALRGSLLFRKLKRAVKEEAIRAEHADQPLAALVPRLLADMGLDVTASCRPPVPRPGQPPVPHLVEPLDHVDAARVQWEASLSDELRAIAEEQGSPLVGAPSSVPAAAGAAAAPAPSSAAAAVAAAAAAAVAETDATAAAADAEPAPAPAPVPEEKQPDKPALRFLFDSKDLLEAVTRIASPNYCSPSPLQRAPEWHTVRVQLRTPSLAELRRRFRELHPRFRQVGLDDYLVPGGEAFAQESAALGERVLAAGFVPVVRQFAKTGVLPSLRPRVWAALLGVSAGDDDGDGPGGGGDGALDGAAAADATHYFERLRARAESTAYVTDALFRLDATNIANDRNYFPFEELLRDTIMCFSRDARVPQRAREEVHARLTVTMPGGATVRVPPSGVQPFRGLVNYAAPLTYLFTDGQALYYTFREMWCRYWCRLNALRSAEGGLLSLCRLFEALVQTYEPEGCCKLLQLGLNPLQIAFPWLQFGFAGYLEVSQVLVLWDRVLGFDDLSVVAVLAAAVFVFRSHTLVRAQSAQEVLDAFDDSSKLEVVPLLQHFLFSEQVGA